MSDKLLFRVTLLFAAVLIIALAVMDVAASSRTRSMLNTITEQRGQLKVYEEAAALDILDIDDQQCILGQMFMPTTIGYPEAITTAVWICGKGLRYTSVRPDAIIINEPRDMN